VENDQRTVLWKGKDASRQKKNARENQTSRCNAPEIEMHLAKANILNFQNKIITTKYEDTAMTVSIILPLSTGQCY
jgi:hypothetical protein